ncbi:hypothetical protein A6R70_17110 [Agrobacterium rubi]|nr:hypothetical protein [Agrobacterium rubi]
MPFQTSWILLGHVPVKEADFRVVRYFVTETKRDDVKIYGNAECKVISSAAPPSCSRLILLA